ncbi:sperm-associated antigen 8 isoform X2 [Pelodiscus sinensis]|uniref:sperm-associated antigen 8 isoform X2 n=1 Tax=Pelodiscus sinensis TaxID=13735 RepID=UPI003F6C1746
MRAPHCVYCVHGNSEAVCAGAEVMEPERPRQGGSPQGANGPAPTEQAEPHSWGEMRACNGEIETPPSMPELLPCHGERSPCPAVMAGEMPPGQAEMEPCLVEMPPCHGHPGRSLGELPPCMVEMLPSKAEQPEEQPRPVPRGKCLIHNWQEERATEELDRVPSAVPLSEGFVYRHGHRGLLTLQYLLQLADSTTMKDSYRSPRSTGLPVRGPREAMLEFMLYQKYRPTTIAGSSPRPSGWRAPASCLASPTSARRTPPSDGTRPSAPPSASPWTSPCPTPPRTTPSSSACGQ